MRSVGLRPTGSRAEQPTTFLTGSSYGDDPSEKPLGRQETYASKISQKHEEQAPR